jgi:hypothetical protein
MLFSLLLLPLRNCYFCVKGETLCAIASSTTDAAGTQGFWTPRASGRGSREAGNWGRNWGAEELNCCAVVASSRDHVQSASSPEAESRDRVHRRRLDHFFSMWQMMLIDCFRVRPAVCEQLLGALRSMRSETFVAWQPC